MGKTYSPWIDGEPARKVVTGKQLQLTAEVTQNSFSRPVTWTSSDQSIATVDENGLITAKKPGSAIITATTNDGYTAQVIVNVVKKQFFLIRWFLTFLGWLITPLRWVWNVFSWPFRVVGRL